MRRSTAVDPRILSVLILFVLVAVFSCVVLPAYGETSDEAGAERVAASGKETAAAAAHGLGPAGDSASREEESRAGPVFAIIGGLGLFLYGMDRAGNALRKAAGGRTRKILSLLTSHRLAALAVGVLATVLFQSSSATTVMLVGLAGGGIMTSAQSVGVILGSGIGTTLTIQIMAFDIVNFALVAVAVGVVLRLATKRETMRRAGELCIGFGLVFYGLYMMKMGLVPMRSSRRFAMLLSTMASSPVLALLISTVVTAVIQSSAATIGFCLVMARTGMIDLQGSIPIILGANIGTCATAMLSCIGAPREGIRVAVIHLLVKFTGAIVMLPFIVPFASMVRAFSTPFAAGAAREVANAHTVYNLVLALAFLPFTAFVARLARKMVPEKHADLDKLLKHISPQTADPPETALLRAARETRHMGEVVAATFALSMDMFDKDDASLPARVREMDNDIDALHNAIVSYLARSVGDEASSESHRWHRELEAIAHDLEHIGDVITGEIVYLAQRQARDDSSFTMEGMSRLRALHASVLADLKATVAGTDADVTATGEVRKALEEVMSHEEEVGEQTREMDRLHAEQMARKISGAAESDKIFPHLIAKLLEVHHRTAELARALVTGGREEKT